MTLNHVKHKHTFVLSEETEEEIWSRKEMVRGRGAIHVPLLIKFPLQLHPQRAV